MLNFKKFIICFFIFCSLISSIVFATDTTDEVLITNVDSSQITSTKSASTATVNNDMYITNTDSYILTNILNGNLFASIQSSFSTNPRNNGGVINGNIYLVSTTANIQSDVSYSDNIDKNGNYMIDVINSKSIINGNVYAITDNFTIEAGSEIYGDLYLVTKTLTIDPNAVIHGNIFVKATNINFHGQVEQSAYLYADKIDMSYYAYVGRDLFLNAETSTLDGSIRRNAFITINKDIITKSNFKVSENLIVNYADSLQLSGRIFGNAELNAKNIVLKNNNDESLIIHGNLTYASQNDVQIPDETVMGKVTSSKFQKKTNLKSDIGYITLGFVTFLVYTFAIIFLCKKFTPKILESTAKLNVSNLLKGLLVGFISAVAVISLFVILLLTVVGSTLAIFVVIAYVFALFLSVPLLLNKIAESFKFKLNSYVKLLLVIAIVYVIKQIPLVGSLIFTLLLLTGVGNILVEIFKKK